MSEKYQAILDAIVDGDEEAAEQLVTEALGAGLAPVEIMQKGVVAGINKTGEMWKANEYFLPDIILAADAFKSAMKPLQPRLKAAAEGEAAHTFVIGTVEGDMHDLGKSLVIALLEASGFEVVDLGIDVPNEKFVEAVEEQKPAIVGMGAYMTTTMLNMKDIIDELEGKGLRDSVKVMVGGVPTSQEFADEAGADAWGKDALDTVTKARQLVEGA